jgi:hypothetical protein
MSLICKREEKVTNSQLADNRCDSAFRLIQELPSNNIAISAML